MNYFMQLYSPTTFEIFTKSDRTITGVKQRYRNICKRISVGDRFLCYVAGISRWMGILEITSIVFEDSTKNIFFKNDPFNLLFYVKPIVILDYDFSIPFKEQMKSCTLFGYQANETKQLSTSMWRSIAQLPNQEAAIIETLLLQQQTNLIKYDISKSYLKSIKKLYEKTYINKYNFHPEEDLETEKNGSEELELSIPEDIKSIEEPEEIQKEIRESLKVQAMLASIGEKLGFKVWIPKQDRNGVLTCTDYKINLSTILDQLPFNYNTKTMKTIEQIDVIWIKKQTIVRAFEIEGTTSIYSGLLRMSDLLSLQPNIDIKLHIVSPNSRKEQVLREIKRPTFSSLEKPLPDTCSFLSYDSLFDLYKEKHLHRFTDLILEDFEVFIDTDYDI